MISNVNLTSLTLSELFQYCPPRLENIFSRYLADIPSIELKTAMEYMLMNGGKYLRPLLIYATGCLFNTPLENLDAPACAVQLMHTYSLIHDDLPCMDDADLRRGQSTCHKKYGEGMAILTGDALHTLAIQIMASHPTSLPVKTRLQMMNVLSQACGPFGMAAGQSLDISVMNDTMISNDLLMTIYQLKTGALISACIELGRLGALDENEINQTALQQFGQCIGLAFQIQDDILDMETNTELLGKSQGTDAKNNKITYPKLHGLNKAKEKVHTLYQEALEPIDYLGNNAQLLRELTGHMLARKK